MPDNDGRYIWGQDGGLPQVIEPEVADEVDIDLAGARFVATADDVVVITPKESR